MCPNKNALLNLPSLHLGSQIVGGHITMSAHAALPPRPPYFTGNVAEVESSIKELLLFVHNIKEYELYMRLYLLSAYLSTTHYLLSTIYYLPIYRSIDLYLSVCPSIHLYLSTLACHDCP